MNDSKMSGGGLSDPFVLWNLFQQTGDPGFYVTYKELTGDGDFKRE